MASLSDAINGVIGPVGATSGFRWAVNHDSASVDSTAGATAVHALSFKRKMEARPVLMMNDADENFPGVFFERVGNWPETMYRGKHGECSFTVRVYVVKENVNNTRPIEEANELAVQVVENIVASDKLALDWVDSVEWLGNISDPFTQDLHLVLPRWCAGGCTFRVNCKGLVL